MYISQDKVVLKCPIPTEGTSPPRPALRHRGCFLHIPSAVPNHFRLPLRRLERGCHYRQEPKRTISSEGFEKLPACGIGSRNLVV